MTGRKVGVTYAAEASHLLVTALRDGQAVAALVDVSDPGVTLLESGSSARITTHTVVLDGAGAELVEGAADDPAAALDRRAVPDRRRRRGRRS